MRRHVIDYLKSIYNLVANNKNPQMEHIDVKNLRTSDFFLPELVQLVFNKYKKTEDNTLSTGERAQLFAELTALLGEDLLERTLRLLDEWSFITYYTPDRCRKIVELVSKRNTAHVFRILPDINYCKCPYFQDFVLQLRGNTESGSEYVSFTCEHVLAQRLHQLFNSSSREQILTLEQFKYFHEDIYVD